jgi:putative flippase GtrA
MVVGASGTILDFSILALLKTIGLPTLPANTLSYMIGTINNFYWNRYWTFAEACKEIWQKQFFQFYIVSLIGLFLNISLTMFLETPFDTMVGTWGYLPAKVIATNVVIIWNYAVNRLWTFNMRETKRS